MLLQSRLVERFLSLVGSSKGLAAEQRIAICGTHRSGTTLLGSLLAADPGSRQIFEPFNPVFGIADATRSFVAGDWPGNDWQGVIDRFLAADGVQFRTPSDDPRRFMRWLKGTRLAREYAAARLLHPTRLVIKTPFLSLSSQYLIECHGISVVFTVKHPASFFVSLRRVGWHDALPLDDLVAQGVIDATARRAAQTPAARAALFWQTINGHALATHRRFPDAATIWSHERFCRTADDEMLRLTDALHIPYTPKMRLAVSQATHGTIVRPAAGTIHALVRDSAAMIDDWRDQISREDEDELRSRCGSLYGELVGEDW
ncbi:hypothetical protein QH494_18500 [Sphingomonas sp. AR_OL41]|uniref:hypothetical protein n=1 Tax=Sphingomonas sp. AR_OL41 TaxID=3042729 RepID=UPI0024816B7F|nr:hypothetical protein [Sphingomonas sp. AR_OL41]MDH7974184.1 hypothetical protein [Sphingomonas sp. AR_OL41]